MFGKKKEQSVETNGIVYRRAKTWRVALAGCSSGIGMCFYVLLGLASYVANEGYGIATAVVGIILTATRILDGVTDPIIAIIIDKMNTRFGKIRILMVAGWLIESLAVLIMYCWASGKGHGIVLFVFALLPVCDRLYDVQRHSADRSGDAYERPEAPDGRRLEYSL